MTPSLRGPRHRLPGQSAAGSAAAGDARRPPPGALAAAGAEGSDAVEGLTPARRTPSPHGRPATGGGAGAPAAAPLAGLRRTLSSRDAWRRAIVLHEVLGPPAALS